METAPKEWAYVSAPLGELGVHRSSDPVMLRGELAKGQFIEFRAWWTSFGDEAPYWWDLDSADVADWPLLGWRPMTPAERAKVGPDEA